MTAELPSRWSSATVGEVSTLVRGVTFKKSEASNQPDSDLVPILRAGNVQDGRIRVDEDLVYVPSERVTSEQYLCSGDTLIATSSGSLSVVGKSALVSNDWIGAHGAFMAVLRPHAGIQPAYLSYFLQSDRVRKLWRNAAAGTNINNLKRNDLLSTEVPVCPLSEQVRIVAAIEEHFSRLGAAEDALASAQQKVGALLRAVVDDVCRGSWDAVPLVDITTSLRNGVFVSRPASEPPGRPIYRISAVRPLRLRVNDVRYANPEPEGADDYAVDSGDLLFTRYSGNPSYVGAAAVVPESGRGVLHPDKLIRVVADKATVLPEWIAAYVSVGEGRRQVEHRLKTTAGQVGISGRQLKSVPIAVPPFDYQRSAVARIGAVMAGHDRIEQRLATLQTKSSALRRSILASAFAGQLSPQDPDDEPVSVLS